jgi:hypothetical protein
MIESLAQRASARIGSLIFLLSAGAWADPGAGERQPAWRWSLDLAPVYQGRANLGGGGDFAVSSLLLRFSGTHTINPRLNLGFSADLDYAAFDFSSNDGLSAAAPWGDTERVTLGAPILYRLDGGWGLFATPSISVAREQGADLSESWIVGGVIGAAKQINPRLRLGIGAGVFSGLEEVRLFLFPSVTWRINDQLTLTNPFRAGPTGPAGLELRWDFAPRWQFAGGMARRSVRFRLDDSGIAPGGVGQDSALLTFVRVTREWDRGPRLDLYAGAALDGELEIENESGKALARENFDAAPLGAIVVRMPF